MTEATGVDYEFPGISAIAPITLAPYMEKHEWEERVTIIGPTIVNGEYTIVNGSWHVGLSWGSIFYPPRTIDKEYEFMWGQENGSAIELVAYDEYWPYVEYKFHSFTTSAPFTGAPMNSMVAEKRFELREDIPVGTEVETVTLAKIRSEAYVEFGHFVHHIIENHGGGASEE